MMLGAHHVPVRHHAPPASTSFPSFPPPVSQSNTWTAPDSCTYVPIAPPAQVSHNETLHHVKRERDVHAPLSPMQQDEHASFVPTADGMASPSRGKKQRPSNYRPPHNVNKKSVVAMTGSLVGGGWEQSKTSVRMRRELSGGQLDQFFREHDAEMEDDEMKSAVLRPRSMSF